MDAHFNESCAEVFGSSTYRYCLMQKDGFFQWRWMEPLPPEAGKNAAVSPVFHNQLDAIMWLRRQLKALPALDAGWSPVNPA